MDFSSLDSTGDQKKTSKSSGQVQIYFPAPGTEIKKTESAASTEAVISKTESAVSTESTKVTQKKQNLTAEVIALQLLQEELRGKLQSKLPADTSFIELVQQIKKCQLTTSSDNDSIECLQYLVMVASDLAKLLDYIVNLDSIVDIRSHFLKVSPNMTDFCLELFDHLVVRESGVVATEMTKLMKDCFFKFMNEEEKTTFIAKVLDSYLSTPQAGFSQNAVLDSIQNLGVSSEVLIHYMQGRL